MRCAVQNRSRERRPERIDYMSHCFHVPAPWDKDQFWVTMTVYGRVTNGKRLHAFHVNRDQLEEILLQYRNIKEKQPK